jgi:hypothetical protein
VGRVDRLQAGDPVRSAAIKVVHSHFANDPEYRLRSAREEAAAQQVGGFHRAAVVLFRERVEHALLLPDADRQ